MIYDHIGEDTPLVSAKLPDGTNTDPAPIPHPSASRHEALPLVPQVTLGLLGLWMPARDTKPAVKEFDPILIDASSVQNTRNNLANYPNGSQHQFFDDDIDNEADENNIEGADRRHRTCCINRSDAASIFYLLATSCLMTYNLITYLQFYWGKKRHLLHLVSYFTFLFQVMVIPFWCLYARILYIARGRRYTGQVYPLFRTFLSERVATLSSFRFGAKAVSWFRLVCFLAWPVSNAILRIINDYTYKEVCYNQIIYRMITHWGAFLGYLFYGSFCHLVYIERVSFECEVRQLCVFARAQAPSKNVDEMRGRISHFYARYNVLRRLIRMWMAFTMVVATWGLTAHLTWNYLVFSENDINPEDLESLRILNILVGSQKIMFFVIPFLAIGGVNLEHVWKRFKYEVTRNQEYRHDAYWTAIYRYLFQINVDHSGDLTPTLIFSAIGFYLGLNLGNSEQNYKGWSFPSNCNASNMSNFL